MRPLIPALPIRRNRRLDRGAPAPSSRHARAAVLSWRFRSVRASLGGCHPQSEFHEKIGPARITDRIHSLNAQMREGLSKMSHVVIYTRRNASSVRGLVCFD